MVWKPSNHPGSALPRRKGVRFDDQRNRIVEIEPMVNADEGITVEELWYQPWERKEHKRQLKLSAREWRQTGLGILLHDTFVNPNPKQAQSCLNAFTQLADSEYSRGIERYLSQQHDEQRIERKRSFVQDVLQQARYLETIRTLTDDEKVLKLAEFSALQSKCAEVFARRIGKADETVVQKGEDPTIAAKLVTKLLRNEYRRSRSSDAVNVMPTHESRNHRRTSLPLLSQNLRKLGF
jgi:hypothetical protein